NVELKHVDLDQSMIRAIAKEAEAERLRRAKVISAQGEAQAAANILEAGRVLHEQPEAMQIRYLTAMLELAGERTSTVIFPLPIDLLSGWREARASKPDG
ncbi:MAG: slipin family protein, partial [Nitrospirota bacterium]|nr:slipin family protein [Nitrospirota bacterium]